MGSTLKAVQCRLGVQLLLHSPEHYFLFHTVLETELEQKGPRRASETPVETRANPGHPRVASVSRGNPVPMLGVVSFGGKIPLAKVQILLSELSTLFEVSGVGRDLQVGWPWLLTDPATSFPFFSNGKHPQGSAMPPWGPTFVTFSGTLLALPHGFGDRA